MVSNVRIVARYKKNPIITLGDIPQPSNSVFNAGATKYKDEYILLLRVEGLEGKSRFFLAKSKDGFYFDISERPVMEISSGEPFATYEKRGIEDPRITKIKDKYYILYTAFSHSAARIALAVTKDFKNFERVALISEPENKDAALFPRKIGGHFVRFDRPVTGLGANVWMSYSPDLIYWGGARCVMETRSGYWDCDKIGVCAPPIETKEGWFALYHAVKRTTSGSIYRLGTALFDLKDPSRLIARCEAPILSPEEYYERTGDVPNVIFCCGTILEEKTGEVKIYYGASDTSICLAVANLKDLINRCFNRC
jgi:predicted GH43/DUF377 family glycosyl hydrolase